MGFYPVNKIKIERVNNRFVASAFDEVLQVWESRDFDKLDAAIEFISRKIKSKAM